MPKPMKIHLYDLEPYDVDIVADLDQEKDAKALARNNTFCRIVIWKNGKRVVAWVGITEVNGKVRLRLTVNQNGKEIHRDVTARPWLKIPKED